MIYFCYFLIFFLVLRLLVALINMLSFHYLPKKVPSTIDVSISVLIPARNEEHNIGDLLKQLDDYSSALLEIIVYDDSSTDSTAAIVNGFVQDNSKFKLLRGVALPEGWLGKNHACHQLSQKAQGDVLLFLDADVKIRDGAIPKAILHLQTHELHLLSIFPKQIFSSFGEKVTVPIMNWILLSLLPIVLVRTSKNPAFSAANGQFMMFRANTYKEHVPHQLFRNHMVEDIAIIQYFKTQLLKSDTLLGNKDVECRMYSGAKEAIEGFTKNIFQFFGDSILMTLLVAVTTTIAPLIIYLNFGVYFGTLYVFGIVLIRIFVSVASRQSPWQNVLLLLPQHALFLIIIGKRLVNNGKKELIWKGRNVFGD
ncbi:MAG: glycosyltransferase involved in cell wall biosynthesis [Flavobacteriales bacterium]|jgi:glycosyltransferase involved in cell wall biosynthesis